MAFVLGFVICHVASAQTTQQSKRPIWPAFTPIEYNPAPPRVLLIGDSISFGYTRDVRKQLTGIANVYHIPANGRSTLDGLANIDKWLGNVKWDVIHFNWGLHDLKYVNPKTQYLASPTIQRSMVQTPLEQYEVNLRKLVERLQKTGATLIWCSTTPVPDGASGRVMGDELKYNAVAARVMLDAGIHINDLHAFAQSKVKGFQFPKDVHFTSSGSAILAEQVAAEIKQALPNATGEDGLHLHGQRK